MDDKPSPFLVGLIAFCAHDRDVLRKRLTDLEAGRLKLGTSNDGRTWTDTTQQDIEAAKAKLAELDRFLSKYDA